MIRSAAFRLVVLCLILPLGRAEDGGYLPVFREVGFTPNGGYVSAGFQATVNHFGGNLMLSATDVAIPGLGPLGLSFSRSYNSNRAYDAEFNRPFRSRDSPLGQGWTAHLGILYPNADHRPVWADPSGGREIFYRHDHLLSQLPIVGDGNQAWISSSLKILVRDGPDYLIYTPGGLTYRLASQVDLALRKPVEIADVHGNKIRITYEADSDTQYSFNDVDFGYVNHPLIRTIEDDWGRRLQFFYQTVNGRKRLQSVRLGTQTLASYTYTTSGEQTFLRTHATGAGRTTTYTVDTTNPGKGAVTEIELDTGGVMRFAYETKSYFYRLGSPAVKTYSVTAYENQGGTWTYAYPDETATADFVVTVNGPEGYSAAYRYHHYGASFCANDLYRVGTLARSEETIGGTTRIREIDYAGVQISTARIVDLCGSEPVSVPVQTQIREQIDGVWLTTDLTYDALGFPTVIDAPGVRRDRAYRHVAATNFGAVTYALGLPQTSETRADGHILAKTVWNYPGSDPKPNWVRHYTDAAQYDQVNLNYFTSGAGKRGALRRVDFGGLDPRVFDYQNGQLASIDRAGDAPDTSRAIHANGTAQQETADGVTRQFSWDADFRPVAIAGPEATVNVAYSANQVIMIQADARLTETYDAWGRLVESRERLASGTDAVHQIAYDALGRVAEETLPTGARYRYAYDVLGRVVSQDALNVDDDREASFAAAPDGRRSATLIRNGAVTTVETRDALGRIRHGALQGHAVSHDYSGGTQLTIAPENQPMRLVDYDWRGRKLGETHPETGRVDYAYNAAGWQVEIDKPGALFAFDHDAAGRVSRLWADGAAAVDFGYHPLFGAQDWAAFDGHGSFLENFDIGGRFRASRHDHPEAPAPADLQSPRGDQSLSGLTAAPRFAWQAGAGSYEIQIETPFRSIHFEAAGPSLDFAELGFVPVPGAVYAWRVRAADGEAAAPWSEHALFSLDAATCGVGCLALNWGAPLACFPNPASAPATVGDLVRYLNNFYTCPTAD